jgi:hypothetical protein
MTSVRRVDMQTSLYPSRFTKRTNVCPHTLTVSFVDRATWEEFQCYRPGRGSSS